MQLLRVFVLVSATVCALPPAHAAVCPGSCAPAAAQRLQQGRDEEVVRALYQCFVQHLARNEGDGAVPQTASTDLFFWDQLGEASREMGGPARLLWCQPWFVEPLQRAWRGLLPKPPAPGQRLVQAAPQACQGFDEASRLVSAAGPWGASTRRSARLQFLRQALKAPRLAGWDLSFDEQTWLYGGAVAAAMFLFDEPSWHAMSVSGGEALQAGDVERSRLLFVRRVAHLVQHARRATGPARLVALGMATSLLTEMLLAPGLSPQERQALHFLPEAPAAGLPQQQLAQQAIEQLLFRAFAAPGPGHTRRSMSQQSGDVALRQLLAVVRTVVPAAQRLQPEAIIAQWRLAQPCLQAPEQLQACGQAGRWDAEQTLEQLWRAL